MDRVKDGEHQSRKQSYEFLHEARENLRQPAKTVQCVPHFILDELFILVRPNDDGWAADDEWEVEEYQHHSSYIQVSPLISRPRFDVLDKDLLVDSGEDTLMYGLLQRLPVNFVVHAPFPPVDKHLGDFQSIVGVLFIVLLENIWNLFDQQTDE